MAKKPVKVRSGIMKYLVSNDKALPYMLAGKSEVTMISTQTGNTLSYKIIKKKSDKNESEFIYFIYHISENELIYAGIMVYKEDIDTFEFYKGQKGNLDTDHIAIKGLLSVVNKLHKGNYDIPVEIYHCGRCGKCGKRLTTPDSILSGVGPECAKRYNIPHPKNRHMRMVKRFK